MGEAHKPIHVLVVDDSAVVRETVSALIASQPDMTVAAASDPLVAMAKMKRTRPDVILLDLEMPRMDGLTFLRQMMETDPIPVVICSSLVASSSETAARVLEEGAVAAVGKPRLGVREFLHDSAIQLLQALRDAAQAKRSCLKRAAAPTPRSVASADGSRKSHYADRVIAIGSSVGGTQALDQLIQALPPDSPGVVIVQHMPEGFTRPFAEALRARSGMVVKEAESGEAICKGEVLIAPGNRHLLVRRQDDHYQVRIVDGPMVSHHRPSVDVLFRSVAEQVGSAAVGVILTGMGEDGAAGLLEMKRVGAATLAQDEATSVVFGMPKAAIARGAVDQVVPLSGIVPAIMGIVGRRATGGEAASRE
jgi:two-component system chemotaxis response regulator CheB